jgi:cobalamin-dependent methionine synthase I
MQAIGAERIEALCDVVCAELKEIYGSVGDRFSPGYGDFSLTAQRDIFTMLGCEKRIGLTLNDSLLMSPTKSVTAIIGLKKQGNAQ